MRFRRSEAGGVGGPSDNNQSPDRKDCRRRGRGKVVVSIFNDTESI